MRMREIILLRFFIIFWLFVNKTILKQTEHEAAGCKQHKYKQGNNDLTDPETAENKNMTLFLRNLMIILR